jgi:hypothetical protein
MQLNSEYKSSYHLLSILVYPILFHMLDFLPGVAFLFASHSFTMIQRTMLIWEEVSLDAEDFIRALEPRRVDYP